MPAGPFLLFPATTLGDHQPTGFLGPFPWRLAVKGRRGEGAHTGQRKRAALEAALKSEGTLLNGLGRHLVGLVASVALLASMNALIASALASSVSHWLA